MHGKYESCSVLCIYNQAGLTFIAMAQFNCFKLFDMDRNTFGFHGYTSSWWSTSKSEKIRLGLNLNWVIVLRLLLNDIHDRVCT
jgi:hypothetical protein